MGPNLPINFLLRPIPRGLRIAALLLAGAAAAPLAGCSTVSALSGMSASIDQRPLPANEADLRAYAEDWGKRYDAHPGEKVASINYARALRALTRYDEAVAVLQAAAVKAPKDYEVLGAYGKALADDGKFDQAKDVLARAYPPERPDWTIMSVQGSVADRLGDHDAARQLYRDALKIAPGEPSVLTNLGLSYALTKELPLAEETLREAIASPHADTRTRQNFALVLALEGKFPEAEAVSRRDMSAEAASANVQAIRRMIAQSDTWRDLQTGEKTKRPPAAAAAAPAPATASPLAFSQPAG
ncbi:MAG: tetratricopeptide repeat protein [Hyphomicrobiales bacterium]|nr:tetratricopeptide repeat protein [Hyphomicrobiales bacterium]